jgi:lichenan operon transcriptional antiterminator
VGCEQRIRWVRVNADRQQRLVAGLRQAGGWVGAPELAELLGVSTRTVRTYVAAVNGATEPPVIETSHRGYRLRPAGRLNPEAPSTPAGPPRPLTAAERLHRVVRDLVAAHEGLDLHALSDLLEVSSSTIEGDLRRARSLLPQYRLELVRNRDVVRVEGSEVDKRRLIRHTLAQAVSPTTLLTLADVQNAYPSYDVPELERVVQDTLGRHDLAVNGYAVNTLVLHLVITLDRITEDRTVTDGESSAGGTSAAPEPQVREAVQDLVAYARSAYGVEVDAAETATLVAVLASKATIQLGTADAAPLEAAVGEPYVALVRRVVALLEQQYLVEIHDERFVVGLALHVRNLEHRVRSGRPVTNPLAAQIKESHPLVHELAVFFAQHVGAELDVPVSEDEIGFIALHIGGCLERQRGRMEQATVALLVPEYHQFHRDLADRLADSLGERARLIATFHTAEQDWSQVDADLVVTPFELSGLHPARQVVVSPLLTQQDLEAVHQAVLVARRRTSWLRAVHQLRLLVDRQLFMRDPGWIDRNEVLMGLADAMERAGIVDSRFLPQVLEREAMSPTVFGEGLAVPHAMTMEARRSAIAVCVSDRPIDWNGAGVRLVLLVAFNADDRRIFRDVFDQIVVALSEPARVRKLVTAAQDYEAFIADLMDALDV